MAEELRFVEVPGATVLAWLDKKHSARARLLGRALALLGAFVGVATFLGATVTGALFGVPLMLLAAALFGLGMSNAVTVYHRMTIDEARLKVEPLRIRQSLMPAQPDIGVLKTGDGTRYMLGDAGPSVSLPYVDIAEMGHTDYSLWFDDDAGTRTEITLEDYPRAEVQRLYEKVEPLWRAMRTSVQGEAEQAEQRRKQVASLSERKAAAHQAPSK